MCLGTKGVFTLGMTKAWNVDTPSVFVSSSELFMLPRASRLMVQFCPKPESAPLSARKSSREGTTAESFLQPLVLIYRIPSTVKLRPAPHPMSIHFIQVTHYPSLRLNLMPPLKYLVLPLSFIDLMLFNLFRYFYAPYLVCFVLLKPIQLFLLL